MGWLASMHKVKRQVLGASIHSPPSRWISGQRLDDCYEKRTGHRSLVYVLRGLGLSSTVDSEGQNCHGGESQSTVERSCSGLARPRGP